MRLPCVYGEPRMTNDIDVVVSLKIAHTPSILRAFPEPDFYCSVDAVKQAITEQFQFNILHIPSRLKVDVILTANSDFEKSQFARLRFIQTAEKLVCFASP